MDNIFGPTDQKYKLFQSIYNFTAARTLLMLEVDTLADLQKATAHPRTRHLLRRYTFVSK